MSCMNWINGPCTNTERNRLRLKSQLQLQTWTNRNKMATGSHIGSINGKMSTCICQCPFTYIERRRLRHVRAIAINRKDTTWLSGSHHGSHLETNRYMYAIRHYPCAKFDRNLPRHRTICVEPHHFIENIL